MTAWSRTAPVARFQHSIVSNDQKSSAHKMLSLLSERGVGEASVECQLFQRGRCHYGDHCKYRHVSASQPTRGSETLERDRESAKVVRGSGNGAVSTQISQRARCERINSTDGGASYPLRSGAADCQYYLKTGKCNYGSRCKFNHPFREDSLVNALNRRDCFDFVQKGTCPYGKTCKYNHPTSEQDMSNIFENPPRPSISEDYSSPPSNSLNEHRRSASEPRRASKRSTDEVASGLRDKVTDRRQLHSGARVDQPPLRWEEAPAIFGENLPSFTTFKERRLYAEATDRAEKDIGWKKAAALRAFWADEHVTSGISSRNDFSPVHAHTYDVDRGSYYYPPSQFMPPLPIERVDRGVFNPRDAWNNHLSRMKTADCRVAEVGDEEMKREIGTEVRNRDETTVSALEDRKWQNGFALRESTCDINGPIREPYNYDLTTTSRSARGQFGTSMKPPLSKYDEDVTQSRKDLHNMVHVKNDTSFLEQRTFKEQHQYSGSWDAQETPGVFRRHGHPLQLHPVPFLSEMESDQSSPLSKNPPSIHRRAVYDRARQLAGAPAEVRARTFFTTPSPCVYHETRENQIDQHPYTNGITDKVNHTKCLSSGVGPIGYNYFPSQENELLEFNRDSVWKPAEKSTMFGPGLFGMQHSMF